MWEEDEDEEGEEVRRVQGVKQKALLKRSVEEQKQIMGILVKTRVVYVRNWMRPQMKRRKEELLAKI